MTTPSDPNAPATQPDTHSGQGGTGGGQTPPATTRDTEATPGASTSGVQPGPAVSGTFDTTSGGGTDTNPADDPGTDTYAAPTSTAVGGTLDTTKPAYDPDGGANDPAYRPPSGPVPATNRDTVGRGGSTLSVNPGSPDAALVGDGVTNPNAQEPGITNSAYATGGTRDTTNAGAPAFTTVPTGGVPAAPTGVTATVIPARRAVIVSWTPGDATHVTGWVVESNTQGTIHANANVNEVEFEEGLIGGDRYTFTVFALTPTGSGHRSAPSAPVTIPTGDQVADTTRDEGI